MLKFFLKSWCVILLLSSTAHAAIDFDASDDFLDCGSPAAFDFNDGSIIFLSAWINIDSNAGGGNDAHMILRKSDFPDSWLLDIVGDTTNDKNFIEFCVDSGSPACTNDTELDAPISIGIWYHVAGSYDGSNRKVYVDGIEREADGDSGAIDDQPDENLCIGVDGSNTAGNCGTTRHFDGKIEEIFIGDEIPSANELLNLASGVRKMPLQAGFTPSSVRGYWPLDDFADGTALDTLTMADNSLNGNGCVGDHGAGASGLTAFASQRLTYP